MWSTGRTHSPRCNPGSPPMQYTWYIDGITREPRDRLDMACSPPRNTIVPAFELKLFFLACPHVNAHYRFTSLDAVHPGGEYHESGVRHTRNGTTEGYVGDVDVGPFDSPWAFGHGVNHVPNTKRPDHPCPPRPLTMWDHWDQPPQSTQRAPWPLETLGKFLTVHYKVLPWDAAHVGVCVQLHRGPRTPHTPVACHVLFPCDVQFRVQPKQPGPMAFLPRNEQITIQSALTQQHLLRPVPPGAIFPDWVRSE